MSVCLSVCVRLLGSPEPDSLVKRAGYKHVLLCTHGHVTNCLCVPCTTQRAKMRVSVCVCLSLSPPLSLSLSLSLSPHLPTSLPLLVSAHQHNKPLRRVTIFCVAASHTTTSFVCTCQIQRRGKGSQTGLNPLALVRIHTRARALSHLGCGVHVSTRRVPAAARIAVVTVGRAIEHTHLMQPINKATGSRATHRPSHTHIFRQQT